MEFRGSDTLSFNKLNDEELEVEYEYNDETGETEPVLYFGDERFSINDFIRVHNNPWFCGDSYPDFIHGVYSSGYNSVYIELIGTDCANLYEVV